MENQVKANTVRIQVLEEQNETLRNSVSKVLSLQQGPSPPKVAWEKVLYRKPITKSWELRACHVIDIRVS